MLKDRSALILKILLENNVSPFSVSQLARKINVSERSIRYDLDEIEGFLKDKNLRLKKKPKIGIWIEGDLQNKYQLLEGFGEVGKTDYYSRDQRINLILFHLLTCSEPIIIKEFEIDLKVSESTILRDLEQLEEKLYHTELTLHRRPNTGVWIEGREWEKRVILYSLIHDEMDQHKISIGNFSLNKVSYLLPKKYKRLIEIMNEKADILSDLLRNSNLYLTKASISSLLIQLFIVILRNEQKERISFLVTDVNYLKQRPEFQLANQLLDQLSNNENKKLSIDEKEAYFIAIHLLGSRSNFSSPYTGQNPIEDLDSKKVAEGVMKKMVRVIEQFLGYSFKNDKLLFKGLSTHFQPMIYRMLYKIPVEKPDTSNLEEKYPGIYTATAAGVQVVEEVYKLKVPADEIAFLAFYIGAAIERQKTSTKQVTWNVLLVCDTGLGTAQLLKERVQSVFPDFVIKGTCGMSHIEEYKGIVDLCLSTVPIQYNKEFGVPIIETSPLLNYLDVTNIQTAIQHSNNDYRDTINDFADKITKKAASLGFYHPDFKEEVRRILTRENPSQPDKQIKIRRERQKMLAELLTNKTVFVTDEIGTWEDSVKKAGQLLEEIGAIEVSYTEAMIQSIYKHGPYIVIAPGIALLHARPEDGVKEVCMSLQVVKNGVKFGHKDRDPVDLVFAFGAMDTQSHLLALSQLMNLFNNEELLQKLRNSGTTEEALEVIQQINKPERVRS